VCDAAKDGDTVTVRAWLDGGGHVDALTRGSTDGGHVDAVRQELPLSLLEAASRAGCAQLVELLLSRGANVDLQSCNGGTALMAAACFGHPSIVSKLLQAGARADLLAGNGATALEGAELSACNPVSSLARRQGCAEAERLLREHAAALKALVGQRVRLVGLATRSELNGTEGLVQEYIEADGRYAVALSDGATVKLRRNNLEVTEQQVRPSCLLSIARCVR
jgi:hypothetical protein